LCVFVRRFVAEGRGQDFADLVDELLSRNITRSYDVATPASYGLSPGNSSPHDIPLRACHGGLSDLYAAGRHPLTCGTSTRKQGTGAPTLLSPLLLGVTVAMSVMSA
jgi:hypothetical protein